MVREFHFESEKSYIFEISQGNEKFKSKYEVVYLILSKPSEICKQFPLCDVEVTHVHYTVQVTDSDQQMLYHCSPLQVGL